MNHTLRPHQLFAQLSPEEAEQILSWLRQEEREVYASSLALLAQQAKLRPVFVQKKTVPAQIAWLKKAMSRLPGEDSASHVLQVWLFNERSEMLTSFLDALEIEHDGKGGIDELPEELEAEKLQAAVEKIKGEYALSDVRLYLHLFQRQRAGGWEVLDALLGEDEDLGG